MMLLLIANIISIPFAIDNYGKALEYQYATIENYKKRKFFTLNKWNSGLWLYVIPYFFGNYFNWHLFKNDPISTTLVSLVLIFTHFNFKEEINSFIGNQGSRGLITHLFVTIITYVDIIYIIHDSFQTNHLTLISFFRILFYFLIIYYFLVFFIKILDKKEYFCIYNYKLIGTPRFLGWWTGWILFRFSIIGLLYLILYIST